MKLLEKEYIEIIDRFERIYRFQNLAKLDNYDPCDIGKVYKDKYVSELFIAFINGYRVKAGLD